MNDLADLLRALADEARLSILDYLQGGAPLCCPDVGICACDLMRHTGLSQGTVSHHMRVLVEAGLVNAERRGRWVYYSLDPTGFTRAQRGLARLAPASTPAVPGVRTPAPRQRMEVNP